MRLAFVGLFMGSTGGLRFTSLAGRPARRRYTTLLELKRPFLWLGLPATAIIWPNFGAFIEQLMIPIRELLLTALVSDLHHNPQCPIPTSGSAKVAARKLNIIFKELCIMICKTHLQWYFQFTAGGAILPRKP